MKRQNAFTVLELLISLALLMILISIASQNYNHLFSQQALVASTDKLYHFLVLAKSQSIKFNKKIYVHFCEHKETHEWRMAQSENARCDCFTENSCLVNGVQYNEQLSDGRLVFVTASDITFTGLQASYNTMRFSVNTGSITLIDKSKQKLKVIQSVTRLRVCAPGTAKLGYKAC